MNVRVFLKGVVMNLPYMAFYTAMFFWTDSAFLKGVCVGLDIYSVYLMILPAIDKK